MQLQPLTVAVLILLVQPAQGTPAASFCPTRNTAIFVDFVNTTPKTATVGTTVTVKFHVTYPEGTPASIKNASFFWDGPAGQEEYEGIQVTLNGTAGFYQYTQDVTRDLIHAVGRGQVTISVAACPLHDVYGNDGPAQPANSETTKTPNDNSTITICQPAGNTRPPHRDARLIPGIYASNGRRARKNTQLVLRL